MRADSNPCDRIFGQYAECAVVVSDADAEAIRASLQAAEVQRWMMRIATPQLIALEWPVADQSLLGFIHRLPEKEIQLTCSGVSVRLLVPACLLLRSDPLEQTPILFRLQARDRRPPFPQPGLYFESRRP